MHSCKHIQSTQNRTLGDCRPDRTARDLQIPQYLQGPDSGQSKQVCSKACLYALSKAPQQAVAEREEGIRLVSHSFTNSRSGELYQGGKGREGLLSGLRLHPLAQAFFQPQYVWLSLALS